MAAVFHNPLFSLVLYVIRRIIQIPVLVDGPYVVGGVAIDVAVCLSGELSSVKPRDGESVLAGMSPSNLITALFDRCKYCIGVCTSPGPAVSPSIEPVRPAAWPVLHTACTSEGQY